LSAIEFEGDLLALWFETVLTSILSFVCRQSTVI